MLMKEMMIFVIRQDEKLTISTLPMAYSEPTIQSQA